MRSSLAIGLALVIMAAGTVGLAEAQDALTKQDRQGPVTVAVTLSGPVAIGIPVKVKVALDTHSVALDGIAFEQVVAMRTADGTDIAPAALEQAEGSGHHRQAVLAFPSLASDGPVRIVVKNVGGVAERTFLWELPLRP